MEINTRGKNMCVQNEGERASSAIDMPARLE